MHIATSFHTQFCDISQVATYDHTTTFQHICYTVLRLTVTSQNLLVLEATIQYLDHD